MPEDGQLPSILDYLSSTWKHIGEIIQIGGECGLAFRKSAGEFYCRLGAHDHVTKYFNPKICGDWRDTQCLSYRY